MEKNIFKAFKALGEPTRLRIIKMLSIQSMCVCELSAVLDMTQPRVSQHLKILKETGLVNESKEGYWVYHSLNRESLHRLWNQFLAFLDADLRNLEGYEEELQKLSGLESNEKVIATKERIKAKNT